MNEVVIVDVNKSNGTDLFPSLTHAIQSASFIALDAVSFYVFITLEIRPENIL